MKKTLLIVSLLIATSAFARDGYYAPPVYYSVPQAYSNPYNRPRVDSVEAIGNAVRRDIEIRNNYEGAMRYQYIMEGPNRRVDR